MHECLFDGPIPKDSPHGDHYKFISSHCGEKIYLIGFSRLHDQPLQPPFTMLEISKGRATTYSINEELLFCEAIYYLDTDLFVTFSYEDAQLHQSVWKLNRKAKEIEKLFYRIINFSVVGQLRISTSRLLSGYILIYSELPVDGHSYALRFVAANPSQVKEFPDIFLDKEVAKLQKKCLQRDLIIYSQPFVSADSIYFLAGDLNVKCCIGSISKEKGKTKIEIFDIEGNGKLPLTDCLQHTLHNRNSNEILWMPYILYKPSRWRLTFSKWSNWICSLAIYYIGRPLVSFAEYDNGYFFYRFICLVYYVMENTDVNIDALSPSLALMILNFKGKNYHRFDNQIKFPVFTSKPYTTASLNGDLLFAEPYGQDRLRLTRFRNPFRVPKLLEIAYEMCKEMYPSTTDKLRNILNVNG